jgi:hypothetical protein
MVWIGVWSDIVLILVRLVLFSSFASDFRFDWVAYMPDGAVDLGREKIPTLMVVGTLSAMIAAALRTWCAFKTYS